MEIPTLINWASPFPFKELLDGILHFIQILIEHSVSKQWRQTFKRAYFSYFSYFSLLFWSAPTFPYFFMKMPYYPYFFTLKCHLRVKNPEIFPRSDSMFIQGARRLTPQFLMFSLKVSLFGYLFYFNIVTGIILLI